MIACLPPRAGDRALHARERRDDARVVQARLEHQGGSRRPSGFEVEHDSVQRSSLLFLTKACAPIVILALNVYKRRGMTRYGWRKQQEQQRNR